MNILYLSIIIIGCTVQSVIKKPYADRFQGKGIWFTSLVTSFTAMLFFVLTSKGLKWDMALVPYSILFALSYVGASVFGILAITYGSVSLSSLVTSYSLLVPMLYGLIFLNDPISKGLFPGLIMLIIAFGLIGKKGEHSSFSLKWVIYVLLAFICNGMCSVSQKMQQIAFDGAYKNEFMILALVIVVLFLGIFTLKEERADIRSYCKYGWHVAVVAGIFNGIVNLFVMILSGKMPVSVMFPLISAGGIVMTYIVSKVLYKEKLTLTQFVGFVLGVLSIVLLNI